MNYLIARTAIVRVGYDVFLSLLSIRATNAVTAPWLCRPSALEFFCARLPITRQALPTILSRHTVLIMFTNGPKMYNLPTWN